MHQVHLSDEVFQAVQKRARAAGFRSVDDYVAEVLTRLPEPSSDEVAPQFSPAQIERIEQVRARVRAGEKTFSMDEVRDHFKEKLTSWLEKPAD